MNTRILALTLTVLLLFAGPLSSQDHPPPSALDVIAQEDPTLLQELTLVERTILQAMTPEQAALFLSGVDPNDIILTDGLTLASFMITAPGGGTSDTANKASRLVGEGNLLLTLINPTPAEGDSFGISVASTPNGNVIVGANKDDARRLNSGAVHLFDGITGNLLLTITNPILADHAEFGKSVASTPDGNIIVGADGGPDGAAYLFDDVDGSLLFEVFNPEPASGNSFGGAVASTPNGDIIIGEPGDDSGVLTSSGSIHLFDGTTGTLLFTINNPDPGENDFFGGSVASTPDGNIIVGAHQDDTGNLNAGSVYLFDGITADLLLTINNPKPDDAREEFGASIASTSDGAIVVGAPRNFAPGIPRTGSIYLFDGATGNLLLTIDNPEPGANERFGHSVASTFDGNIIVGKNQRTTDAGTVYLFDGATGSLLLTIDSPQPNLGDEFGVSVASTPSGNIIVGSRADDIGAANTGTAYLFEGTSESSPTLTANFTSDLLIGEAPLMVQFTNTSTAENTAITSFSWDFESDAIIDSTEENPSFIYTDTGTFSVSLTVSDGTLTNTVVRNDLITVDDSTPPIVTPPPDIVAEATSGTGAIVNYPNATSTDNVGVVSGPDCVPVSSSLFALGTTTVTCTATDAAGNVGQASFTITVEDTTPPETLILAAIDGNNLNVFNNGTTVSDAIAFTFDGIDAVGVFGFECSLDGATFSTCSSPRNFNGLGLGVHAFAVSAVDTVGNIDVTPSVFSWEILTPEAGIDEIIDVIDSFDLPNGVKSSLLASLKNAIKKLTDNNPNNDQAACNNLDAFIDKVDEKLANGDLDETQASQLIQSAEAVKTAAQC